MPLYDDAPPLCRATALFESIGANYQQAASVYGAAVISGVHDDARGSISFSRAFYAATRDY